MVDPMKEEAGLHLQALKAPHAVSEATAPPVFSCIPDEQMVTGIQRHQSMEEATLIGRVLPSDELHGSLGDDLLRTILPPSTAHSGAGQEGGMVTSGSAVDTGLIVEQPLGLGLVSSQMVHQSVTRPVLDWAGPTSPAVGEAATDSNRLLHFSVPIKRPVLQTPVAKLRATSAAKKRMDTLIPQKENLGSTTRSERRSSRLANKPRSNLSVEEQATALLIKKCGLAENITTPTVANQNKLHTQFVGPLEANVVGGLRDMFGLSEEGAPDKLGALLIDAEA